MVNIFSYTANISERLTAYLECGLMVASNVYKESKYLYFKY